MLKNKVCVVTGGTRGIGKAIAQRFSLNRAVVYVIGREKGHMEWISEWNDNYEYKIHSILFDITDNSACTDAVLQVKREQHRLDVLVNNAGVEFNERIGMISRDHMEKMFSINVYGTIQMLQVSARVMGRQKAGGSIVNISSIVGVQGNPGQLVYSATKGAVISLTKTAAKELASSNIRVNAIAPGLTNTEMIMQTREEYLEQRIQKIAMGRLAETEEVADACLFFASDLSRYVSGQVLGVDGCTSL